jgi:succinate dehydrogenase / fumarate reductase iron-sulfur subunit
MGGGASETTPEPDPPRLAPGRSPARGGFVTTRRGAFSPDMSFLELLDVVNEGLILKGVDPIAFDHDCREGICGQCGVVVDGEAHGPRKATTSCQLHMRSFADGDVLTLEPFRPAPSRSSRTDGGPRRARPDRRRRRFISVPTGSVPEANTVPVPKGTPSSPWTPRRASAAGPASPRAPTPRPCSSSRPRPRTSTCSRRGNPNGRGACSRWSIRWTAEGFGACSTHAECEAVCPKEIRVEFIARTNRDYLKAALTVRI